MTSSSFQSSANGRSRCVSQFFRTQAGSKLSADGNAVVLASLRAEFTRKTLWRVSSLTNKIDLQNELAPVD